MLVRRDWAQTHAKSWAAKWDRAIKAGSRRAASERRERLTAWRSDRANRVPADDRIILWIDQERKRLDDPARFEQTPLMLVHLARGDVRSVARQPRTNQRLLQLGWLCGLGEVETMALDDLKDAVESRGYAADQDQQPSLAGLLPLVPESDLAWLARRAATELAVDRDLRFLRFQGMILPDLPAGQVQAQGLAGLDLSAALGGLSSLLDPQQGQQDPLAATLKKVGDRGRVGALVTRLDVPADLAEATVEITLWVRAGPLQWVPFLTRSSSVRTNDVAPGEGPNLAADPQVKSAFAIVESLGLGQIPQEVKDRSLRMGAATDKALGAARAAISQDLSSLGQPVFEQAAGVAGPNRPPGRP
jgi:hypothetical protein